MRSPKMLKISTSSNRENMEPGMTPLPCLPYSSPGHSRNSSGASIASTPMTSTFSLRSHNRWPSSSSSIATSPDSPVNMGKSSLDDLLEEPSEIDELENQDHMRFSLEEFCICDTVLCKHQQPVGAPYPTPPPSSPEWIPGDELVGSTEPARSLKSQSSAVDLSIGKIGSRISRRLPSISSRWRDKVPTTSISSPAARSAPPSRSTSAKHSAKNSLARFLEPHETMLLFAPQAKPFADVNRRPSSPTLPAPSGFLSGDDFEDPIDRKELASTPLLPPILTELRAEQHESFQSPLQSPSVATPSTAATFADTPLSSPIFQSAQSPPLSSKPSFASISRVQSNRVPYKTIDAGSGAETDELEYYNMKLGHANFHIFPEPYMPERCNEESCDQLLADWETARHEYMRQAYAISQNYGPTSNTYKLTSEKWALIDRQWQENIERSRAEAEAHGEKPRQDILPETAPVAQIPSLPFDPEHPDKFPSLNEGGIVGPMVQYAKVQRTPSKKRKFLKLLLEPFSSSR